jgi:DNA-binding NtrC family response regulator
VAEPARRAGSAGRVEREPARNPEGENATAHPQEPCEPDETGQPAVLSNFIAEDEKSKQLLERVKAVPDNALAVMLRGEHGAGRNLVAMILHCLSGRADEPLMRFDCTLVPSNALEVEIFGEERTLSDNRTTIKKRGYLELAGGGTLVLDEVATLSMPVQQKLLRAIEERQFWPVDALDPLPLKARVIALSTADLERAMARRTFREDFYYRMKVACLTVPPLRERPKDIRPLAEHFLDQWAEVHRRPRPRLSDAAVQELRQYWFPGNVRELRDIVERCVLTCTASEVLPQDLPSHLRRPDSDAGGHKPSLEDVERAYIGEVLNYTRGKKTQAANILGISRKTLLEKRKRYGLG